jgi:hypothetical protein
LTNSYVVSQYILVLKKLKILATGNHASIHAYSNILRNIAQGHTCKNGNQPKMVYELT